MIGTNSASPAAETWSGGNVSEMSKPTQTNAVPSRTAIPETAAPTPNTASVSQVNAVSGGLEMPMPTASSASDNSTHPDCKNR